ncbi:hypothetical protein M758_UG309300 [Ceratodon purpureus]|nr:hypothetical protein M758_UG309300 [Ceratodon purpureus]
MRWAKIPCFQVRATGLALGARLLWPGLCAGDCAENCSEAEARGTRFKSS